jgi:hypothetical protein
MKYQVVQTKAGFAVQNTKTYVVASTHNTRDEAERVASNLNK